MRFSKEIPELIFNDTASSAERWSPRNSRDLYSADGFDSYLVDSSGNAYEPYSLAWRYLGLYIDCEISNSTNFYQYYNYNNGYTRKLPEENKDGECGRKLLWAAYVDPKYKGNTIEEYQFYDMKNGTYDDSTCLASGTSHRCVKLDCHESHTHFQLVGIFKETEGMYDWTEQLFKHQGYCIWQGDEDGDVYETMETWMEKWPTSCKQLSRPDYYGNTLYIDMHPLPEGNMTLEIYTDNMCTMLSDEMNLEAYILNLYNYYGYSNKGKQVAADYAEAIETWNEKMSVFKVCQPCRAYNLYYDQNKNSRDHRSLENDGEGDETERYNCYDDAGYTNVDQCYKFETHTRMEPAYESDLSLADDQGSILFIKANGRSYGRGEPYSTPFIGGWDWNVTPEQMMYISFGSIAVVWIAMLLFFHRRHKKKCKNIPSSFGDSLYDDDGEYDSDDSDSTKASKFSKNSRAIYSPPTIELANTADYSAKAGCCAADPAINLSESDADNAYNPPSVVDTNTVDFSTKRHYCAQNPAINLSESEMRSTESLDDDGVYKQLCYVKYNSYSGIQSDANTLGTENDRRCGIQHHGFNQTISEMESMDSNDQSQFKTSSVESEEEQSIAGNGERGSQPDILGTSQSDMSSFESMNHKANRLQQWISMQQQLAKPRCQEHHLPPTQILENVEEEKDDLGDALLRVQQRILDSKQLGRESPGDETAVSTDASSTMSSIV